MPPINQKHALLLLLAVVFGVLIFSRPPIPQSSLYHQFADQREILGIANFYNVISNLPFIVIGLFALIYFSRRKTEVTNTTAEVYVLFASVILIGLGSAWYHYNPNNETLVWDRIPMTITFMSYFIIVLGRFVNKRLSDVMFIPLLLLGIFSVLYWYWSEVNGHGDLRLYAFVQFFPMLAIPLIVFLYRGNKYIRMKIVFIILIYIMAKVFEHLDLEIYSFHHIISGHSLKHLFASLAVLVMLFSIQENSNSFQHKTNVATRNRRNPGQ